MKAHELIRKLTDKIPKKETWVGCMLEPYGPYNFVDLDIEVEKVLYCVTACHEVEEYFKEKKYDVLITHHPIPVQDKTIPQIVLHTALDCCENGLNDKWRDMLGIKDAVHFDGNLGWFGKVDKLSFKNLCDNVESNIESKILGDKFSIIDDVETIVLCTGLGGMVNNIALKTEADCYIYGQGVLAGKDSGFRSVIEIGHTLSERIGHESIKEILKGEDVKIDIAPLDKDLCCYGETHRK